MDKRRDDPLLYRRNLSQSMAELLADPFSEVTRKRQPALLISATVTLLLSAGLARVTEIGVANSKFSLELPQLATWLAFAVTVYLLSAYLIGVWADWAIGRVKRWSPLAAVSDVEAAMISDSNDRALANEARHQKIERLNNELRQIREEMDTRRGALSAREHEIEAALSSMPKVGSASFEENERCLSLAQESAEIVRSQSVLLQERSHREAPMIDAILELLPSSSLVPTVSMLNEHLDLKRALRTFSKLTELRLALEILFPAAYAAFALVWTILHAMGTFF